MLTSRDESGNGRIPYRPTPYTEYTNRIPFFRKNRNRKQEKKEQEQDQNQEEEIPDRIRGSCIYTGKFPRYFPNSYRSNLVFSPQPIARLATLPPRASSGPRCMRCRLLAGAGLTMLDLLACSKVLVLGCWRAAVRLCLCSALSVRALCSPKACRVRCTCVPMFSCSCFL